MNRISFEVWNDDKKKTCKNDDNAGGIILHFHFFVYLFDDLIKEKRERERERENKKLVLVDL